MRINGGGDKLARGAVRATFLTNESNKITQSAWDKAFNDFEPEQFKKEGMPKVKGTAREISRNRL